jgi:hypothetical protein
MIPLPGNYYEFHRRRVISRPGQPIAYGPLGIEIGPPISREEALQQARNGYDVYTFAKSDAYRLAQSLHAGTPEEHKARVTTYYAHYHAGGPHLEIDEQRDGRFKSFSGPGHVFFGNRGGA